MLRCVCPKAGSRHPGEAAHSSPGVPGCIVSLDANLRVPGSSGDRGNIQIPAQMQPHTSRGPREFLSRAVWRPLTLPRLAPPGQGCCAQKSQQSRDERWDCPGARCAEGGDLGTHTFCGVQVASLSFPFVRKARHQPGFVASCPSPVPRAGEDEGSLGALRTSGC